MKGIKKKDLKKKIPAHQRITYERTPTQQIEGDTYDLKGRKIFKHNEQWSISLEKTRQYINQFIREGNRVIWKVYNNIKMYKYTYKFSFCLEGSESTY